MDKKSIIDIVNRFTQSLQAQNIKLHKVILYGSCASGTNKEGSDIDLVVISDDFLHKDYWERIEILSEAIYQIFGGILGTLLNSMNYYGMLSAIKNRWRKSCLDKQDWMWPARYIM